MKNKIDKAVNKLISKMNRLDYRSLAGLVDPKHKDKNVPDSIYYIHCIKELLNVSNKGRISLCRIDSPFYLYNGVRWVKLKEDHIFEILSKASAKTGIPENKYLDYKFRENMLEQLKMDCSIIQYGSSVPKTCINLLNGTYEVVESVANMRDHKKEDLLKYVLPFEFDPKATCPQFQKYLDKCVPDIKMQNILSEFIGYSFTRGLKLEKALLLYGDGANGKSVFYDVICALLGKDNMSFVDFEKITAVQGYHRVMLADKLLNYSSENGKNLDPDSFKKYVSGETMEARDPYGKPYDVYDYAKIMCNCNELPKTVEHTTGFFRRFIIIPFSIKIEKHEQDPKLAEKIISSELTGVFNWVLSGLHRLLKNGKFTESETVNETIAKFKRDSDTIEIFLYENNYSKNDVPVSEKIFYEEYRIWCYQCGHSKPYNKTNMRKRLISLGYEVKRMPYDHNIYINKND